jgi:hypothetical protein
MRKKISDRLNKIGYLMLSLKFKDYKLIEAEVIK